MVILDIRHLISLWYNQKSDLTTKPTYKRIRNNIIRPYCHGSYRIRTIEFLPVNTSAGHQWSHLIYFHLFHQKPKQVQKQNSFQLFSLFITVIFYYTGCNYTPLPFSFLLWPMSFGRSRDYMKPSLQTLFCIRNIIRVVNHCNSIKVFPMHIKEISI